jgi:hypothetical protein
MAEQQPATEPDDSTAADASDEEVREFVEDVESDPAENPQDEDLKRVKGG